jgi:phosphatidylglycerophosphatase A
MKKKLIYLIATGFGSGYSPYIPGTAGSLVGLLLYIILPVHSMYWLAISVTTFFIGVQVSTSVEKEEGKDPKVVVIDEIVGQWLALLFLPRMITVYLAAFILFRLLDIVKPYPANRFEQLKGGTGIMLDDIVAGLYANIVLQIVYRIIAV